MTVSQNQLSLAIGKGGQNVRLAAKLTGWKIDIVGAEEPASETVEDGSSKLESKKTEEVPAEIQKEGKKEVKIEKADEESK